MVRVKVCGITNLEDALAAVEYGADALGFIFVPSPRQVMPEEVRAITDKLPDTVARVGVFMNDDAVRIKDIVARCHLDYVQLHGDESPEFCAAFAPNVIKTFTSTTVGVTDKMKPYDVAGFLIDREKGSPESPEKTWEFAAALACDHKIILAGGLTPENVTDALRQCRPCAVDVASGVEASPGKKDHSKMKDFINAAKGRK